MHEYPDVMQLYKSPFLYVYMAGCKIYVASYGVYDYDNFNTICSYCSSGQLLEVVTNVKIIIVVASYVMPAHEILILQLNLKQLYVNCNFSVLGVAIPAQLPQGIID